MSNVENEVIEKLTNSGRLLTLANASYLTIIAVEATAFFYDNLPISFQVLVIAICCIIAGSYNSVVNQFSSTLEVEKLTAKDAYMFPIIGSCVLCGFYFLIHYLPEYALDTMIRLLFFTVATFSVQSFILKLMNHFIPEFLISSFFNIHLLNVYVKWGEYSKFNKKIEIFYPTHISFPAKLPESTSNSNSNNNDTETGIACRIIDIFTLIIGGIVSVIWFTTQHWLSNNIIGISTSIHAIAFLNPGSYYTAAVLLSLLFFYDIFWVFGTDVMVTVAKNINAPIKLIFPRPAVMETPSMLGLGDIVLPGIYVALLLRYDIWKFLQSNVGSKSIKLNTSKISYSTWFVCLVCYLLALGNCLLIMYYFEHPQPALLYLVPGCILPILAMAFFRGDLMTLWKYDEADDSEATNKKSQ